LPNISEQKLPGFAESLGVDNAIDYTIEDFTKSDQTYDIIFDVAGKSSFSDCKHLLNEGGVFLTTVPTPAIMVQMFRSSIIGSKKVKFMATGLRSPKDKIKDLEFTNSLIEQGKIKAVIDRRFPLNQIADAHKYVETGRKRGNVVITVA
jgi:NADPH:quinone reductase-like Zn-dependent oxidoreductase